MHSLNTIRNLNKPATYVICIGRNISDSIEELSPVDWSNFIKKTYKAVSHCKDEIFNYGIIAGEYNNTKEDSFVITFGMLQGREFELKGKLSELTQKYRQDSIALIKGKTTFIK